MSPTNVDNGEQLRVEAPFYTGDAGVIRDVEGGEFACVSRPPAEDSLPLSARLDGRGIVITAVRRNPSQGAMIAARFVWAETEGNDQ